MTAFGLLSVGDLGLDLYEDEVAPRPGGCALNVACAFAAAARSARVAAAGPVGPDGVWLREVLASRGASPGLVSVEEGATPRQRIALRPDGERVFAPHEPGVLLGFRPSAALRAAIAAADLVSVPVFEPTLALADEVLALRAGRGPTALDLMNLEGIEPAWIDSAIDRAAFVFAGLDPARDAAWVDRVAARARRPGAAVVVVTLGPAGAVAFVRDERFAVAAPPVPGGRVVDTTGCGDAFAGTFLATRASGIDAALREAALAASHVAARRGALGPAGRVLRPGCVEDPRS